MANATQNKMGRYTDSFDDACAEEQGGESRFGNSPGQGKGQGGQQRSIANGRKPTGAAGSDTTSHQTGNERLYEAYNDLHTLAQVFEKPFDAPAILVVGHQTDGKSALVEALMGFQFNHVGGGTKTRRPITLHMKYNAACAQPACFLVADDASEMEMSLESLQSYIEVENARLEAEQLFWGKEIVVRVEYRFCPNLTIIDTPGLISAAPGQRNGVLQNFSRQVEAIVRAKMEQKEFTILCLEDTNDWTNATTRRLVMQVDPYLTRTVMVSTKFDTRIPQFARGADVEMFLRPTGLEPTMLDGAPFFTSVPSGRVGSGSDTVFPSNDAFRDAVAEREIKDVAEIEAKMGRKLQKKERAHIGVGQLRRFLEALLQKRYMDSVPTIVPLLEKETRTAKERLNAVRNELEGCNVDKLKSKGRMFTEAFLTRLLLLMRGSVTASPQEFGETLADEQVHGGMFLGPCEKPVDLPTALPNAHMRLFGGAQFHRAMAEFRLAVGAIQCPDITREEIANACGLEDFHDGVNYMRVACVIAVTKAQALFEPFIHQLGFRLSHILRRLLPITMHLLQKDNKSLSEGHGPFVDRVGSIFHAFIEEIEKSCKARCLEDLQSTTRYVTWSLHTKNQHDLHAMLSKVRMPNSAKKVVGMGEEAVGGGGAGDISSHEIEDGAGSMVDILQNTLWNRHLTVTSEEVVAALMCQIFEGIRDHIVQAAELKFNCFFLMELIDSFPSQLRVAVEEVYDNALDEIFEVAVVRSTCEGKIRSLQAELSQVERLKKKFGSIHTFLANQPTLVPADPDIAKRYDAVDSTKVREVHAVKQGGGGSDQPGRAESNLHEEEEEEAEEERVVTTTPAFDKPVLKSPPTVSAPSSAALKAKASQNRLGALMPATDSTTAHANSSNTEGIDPVLLNPGGVFGSPLRAPPSSRSPAQKTAFLNVGTTVTSPRGKPLAAALSSATK